MLKGKFVRTKDCNNGYDKWMTYANDEWQKAKDDDDDDNNDGDSDNDGDDGGYVDSCSTCNKTSLSLSLSPFFKII